MNRILLPVLACLCLAVSPAHGAASAVVRETAEWVMKKFGKGFGGESVEAIAGATARAVGKHGDDCLPLIRSAGHSGLRALEEAGEKAPEVIKLFARRGDEALWLISEPKKLALFIRHGDDAATALLKHPGIADTFVERFGAEGASAMANLSRGNAQRLAQLADETAMLGGQNAPAFLGGIRKYGDPMMEFVWKHKGKLAVGTAFAMFVSNPEPYLRGVKELVVEPVVTPLVKAVNWTLVVLAVLLLIFIPRLVREWAKYRRAANPQ
jgi:hypothetical protein